MRDVVFTFWRETWSDSVDREYMTPDRFVQGLIRHPSVGRLVIADPYRRFGHPTLRRIRNDPPHAPLPRRASETALVSPLRFQREDGVGAESLRRTYSRYDARVRRAASRLNMAKPAVITTNPFYAAYGDFDWAGPVTYFAYDDWSALDAHARWWPDYDHVYARIRDRGLRVCAVSQHLLDRIGPLVGGMVCPNGIDPQEWQGPHAPPEWLGSVPRPFILYTGAIHGRLDLDAVREIAARYPHGSVVFVGPIADQAVADELRSIPGVQLRNQIHRSLVAGLTAAADVCIMPHRRNQLTQSMSPLKIYEYCAAGRPSVATDIAPVRGIHDHVVLIPEGGSFVEGIEKALSLGPIPESERQSFLLKHAWSGRHDDILKFALADEP
jgi:teichuronic acid biosynthesis glycosyltransferase TuaH